MTFENVRARAVVFDLDGTLVDSAPDIHAAANVMLAALGRAPLDLGRVTSFVGNGVAKLVERCLDATGGADAALGAHAFGIFREAYHAAPASLTRPYPGVEAALDALAGAGCRLGLCTNKPEGPTRQVLDALGLARHFGAVVGGDTLAVMKPDPAPLRLCLDRLGAGPALYVGDSETDAATARAAGLPFALFTRGYRKSPVESFEAVLAFDDFAALVPFALDTMRAA
ncbi:MAG: phosphoglycolate phosphatase [Thermohalobaculum sp.]|nr:phosphoglycolate phosphatase [Thermohalobaculum sp.]